MRKAEKVLRPVRPNLGIELDYRRALTRLIDEMNASVQYWLKASYRKNEPIIAQDAPDGSGGPFHRKEDPAAALNRAVKKLADRWQKKFDDLAPEMAKYFATASTERSSAAMKAALKKGGFTVQFKMTAPVRDITKATVNANVELIKSIPEQYFTQVQGIVMRGVQTGRDLGQISKDLQEQFGVTKRRAALIARDQTNKAGAAIVKARQQELGITQAIWVHSHGGKKPRPSHVKMDGKKYDVEKGMYDPDEGEWVLPGQLINCRCYSRSVITGFS